LEVENGGAMSNTFARVGEQATATGHVTISSGTWTNTGNIYVGNAGTGTLTVETGGTVGSTGLSQLGSLAGSNGSVELYGTGANWTNSGNLLVGNAGEGSLTLGAGGAVTLNGGSGTLTLASAAGSTGGLYIGTGAAAGTLNAATVQGGDGTATVQFNHTDNLTFAPVLSGSLSVTKTGSGTLTFAGTNTYTGFTAVNGGALDVTGSLTTGGLGVGRTNGSTAAVTVSGADATLRIENGSPNFITVGDATGSTGTLTIADGGLVALADGAKLTVGWGGAGTLNLNSGGTVEIGGTADGLQQGSGGTTVKLAGGTLRVADGFSSSVPFTLTNTSALEVTGGTATISGALSGAGGLNKTGAGTLTLSGTSTYAGGTTVSAGTLSAGADGALAANTAYTVNAGTLDLNGHDLTVSSLAGAGGAVTLGAATLTVDQAGNTDYAGGITGTGGLTKQGVGALTLSGTSSYTGETAVNGGALDVTGLLTTGGLGVGRAVGATAVVTVSGAGARLDASGFMTVGDKSGSTGTLTIADGGTVALGAGAKFSLGWDGSTGTLNLNSGGTLEVGGTDGIQRYTSGGSPAGTPTFNFAGGTLRVVHADLTSAVDQTLTSTSSTVDTNGLNATLSGHLTGGGALTKTGAGTLTLAAANSYSGATTVSAGTLALAAGGAFANTSGVDLATGATLDLSAAGGFAFGAAQTLSGKGTVNGDVTVAGTLAPGASPGLMTFNGDLTLGSTATLQIELGGAGVRGTDYDAVDVGGALTYGGTLDVVSWEGFVPVAGDTFNVLDYATATGAFDTLDLFTLGPGLQWDTSQLYSTGSLAVVASAVPEPSTYALIMGALLWAATFGLRRRRAHRRR
jgi:autotransporter-associated beta strand protein/T5SS/PEP-CTERM-associated repeat protein